MIYSISKTRIVPTDVTTEVTLTMSRKVALDLRMVLSRCHINHYISSELIKVMRFLDEVNMEVPS